MKKINSVIVNKQKYYLHKIEWVDIFDIPLLAFDHNDIIEFARERLERRVRRRPVGFDMLPPEFTIGQLVKLYEKALNTKIDKRNLRKKYSKQTF